MKPVVTIENEQLNADQIITFLKFSNEFEEVADKIINDRLLIQAARKHNLEPSLEELQQVADDFRRFSGLHRAKDTQEWLDEMNVSVDDFETFLKEMVMKNKMLAQLTTDDKIKEYFTQHAPDFDAVDIKHILVDNEAKANEIKAQLEDDPDSFDELVLEHSIDEETKYLQGRMMHIRRGTLAPEMEAKVFNAKAGEIVGPIKFGDEDFFEIISVIEIKNATLTEDVEDEVGKAIRDQWLAERAKNSTISFS
ncbi:MAG: peptidylprolyl isomerase [Proteobacteria bacterium]|nr:MAG: peptidylprolyl isomerase [Pseudomonadota bacterium]